MFCCSSFVITETFASVDTPVLSIVFDDGTISQYTYAFPLMQARGLHGTFYVISDQIRDVSGSSHFMSFAELAVLQDAGNEIGSHGKTHISFIGRSESWLRTECSVSKQALESHGLMVNNFAYPYGETDDFVSSIVLQYYSSARTAYNYP